MKSFQYPTWIILISAAILSAFLMGGCSGLDLSFLQPPAKATPSLLPAATQPFVVTPTLASEQPPLEEMPTEEMKPGAPASELAKVESIEIMVSGSIPVEMQVAARGVLPNDCMRLGEAIVEREDSTFKVTLPAIREEKKQCPESPVSFEKKIPLDVKGLPAGLYTVDVNGIIGTFEFAMDNVAPQDLIEQPPLETITDKNTISGMIWHDLCAVSADHQIGAGCIQRSGDNKIVANGILELGEPGIEGVLIYLKQADCSGNPLQTAISDANGKYIFRNVAPGSYCVQVDFNEPSNRSKLIAGEWTFPNKEGKTTLRLNQDEQKSGVNFGWDYQSETGSQVPQDQFNFVPAITPFPTPMVTPYSGSVQQPINTPQAQPIFGTPYAAYPSLPIPAPTLPPMAAQPIEPSGGMPALPQGGVIPQPPNCLNRAALISESMMPSGPTYQPGMNIVKTWRLKNIGTCTWQTGYTLVFVGGDQMNATTPATLTGVVPPNGTVDLSVQITAPDQSGVYSGNWMLRSISGEIFGLGDMINQPLVIQISVSGSPSLYPTTEFRTGQAEELKQLGSPTWYDSFWNDTNWYMVNDEHTVWQIRNGALYMTARKKVDIDRWGLSKLPPLTDFYFEIEASSGAKCGGFDSYGVIVRAQDFDSGYVFGITCNGSYRLYQWDHGFFKNIQPYKPSPHINMGTYQTNRLGVMAIGDKLRLYVNGYFLDEYKADWFKWGQFGLMIGPNQTENLTIKVSEAAYWQFR